MADFATRWNLFQKELSDVIGSGMKRPQVVLVTKGHPVPVLHGLVAQAGVPEVWGENYADELLGKAAFGAENGWAIRWAFIGRPQSRSLKKLLPIVSEVHGIQEPGHLEILAKFAQANGRCPKFFLQVHLSGEETKGGLDPEDACELGKKVFAGELAPYFAGYMGMPVALTSENESEVRAQFAVLREVAVRTGLGLGLSMGMSDDWKIAVQEGATCLRLGSRLLGPRQ